MRATKPYELNVIRTIVPQTIKSFLNSDSLNNLLNQHEDKNREDIIIELANAVIQQSIEKIMANPQYTNALQRWNKTPQGYVEDQKQRISLRIKEVLESFYAQNNWS